MKQKWYEMEKMVHEIRKILEISFFGSDFA